jgi:serine/threonine protein kinase/Tfp pilus assembly protein PilF
MADDDLHQQATLGGLAAEETTQDFPVKSWDRYKFVAFLGEGGMGRVYKAFDPRLKRFVALKFIRGDDPTILKRFQQEAQSQARIEHENVCKVFDAGEVDGKFYIAMQYIDGGTLSALRNLTFEQKVKIILKVAEGLHAAHRFGLIHRDVKPGNIMVEKTEDGWRPYVTDFGLVREAAAQGVTVTGVLVGTPHYMAPEQAWGENQKLDSRVDVYSLGATMYEFLTGSLPLDSENTMEVLKKLLEEEPKPLRQINASIPSDLETIVLKCLEKEPIRRYETARALSQDLQRYLENEPILARRASISYRISKKARKHRSLVTVSVIAVAIIAALIIMAIYSAIQSRQRQMLAQRFGQQVEKIESLMRLSHISPLHDVRTEKNAVRKHMKDIQNQMKQLGGLAKAPGSYALGRGYLSLNEYEKAQDHLQQAWNSGYQTPDAAYALGLTLGNIYQKALSDADQIQDKEQRKLKLREIEKEYRDPAVSYLQKSKNYEEASAEYVEGLIAFYQKKYDEALKLSQQAMQKVPWLYEARVLQGRIYVRKGTDKRDRGDYTNASTDFQQAIRAFRSALQTGESDPAAYDALCGLYREIIFVEVFQTGREIQEYGKGADEACGNAILADPEYTQAYLNFSRIYGLWSRFKSERGQDPTMEYQKSIQLAEKAAQIRPDDHSFNVLASAYRFRAEYEMYHGIDPEPAFQKIIFNGTKALEVNSKNIPAYGDLAIAYMYRGEYEMNRGQDPRESLNRAIQNYERSVQLQPQDYGSYNSLANAYAVRSDYEASKGIDPSKSWEGAIANYKKALEINPKYTHVFNNLGTVYEAKGKYDFSIGKDPTASFEEAQKYFVETMKINPSYQHPYINMGLALGHLAEFEMSQGRDPSATLQRAAEANQKGLDISTEAYDLNARTEIHIVEASYELLKKHSPETALAIVKSFTDRAKTMDPSDFQPYALQGKADLIKAKWDGSSAEIAIVAAQQNLKKAIELNPLDALNYVLLAESQLLEQKNIDAGLQNIDKALKLNPQLGDAYAIQGLLFLAKGDRDAAKSAIQKALTLNKNLAYLYSKDLL